TSASNGPEKRAFRCMLAAARIRCHDRRAFLPMQVLACQETPGKGESGLGPFPWTGGCFRPRGLGPVGEPGRGLCEVVTRDLQSVLSTQTHELLAVGEAERYPGG